MTDKIYIGDAVYVSQDRFGMLLLETDRGRADGEPDRIYLEPEVLNDLLRAVEKFYNVEIKTSPLKKEAVE